MSWIFLIEQMLAAFRKPQILSHHQQIPENENGMFLLSDSLFCFLKTSLGRKKLTVVLSVVLPMVSIITFLGIVGVVAVLVTRNLRGRLVDPAKCCCLRC